MRVGLLGTGAIAEKHAEVYATLGFKLAACSNRHTGKGVAFAERWGATFIPGMEELCQLPGLDYIDVCTFPDAHVDAVKACAAIGRPILLQKPLATHRKDGQAILAAAHRGNLIAGVVSQHRFDHPILFLKRAVGAGRLGRLLQADAYVKWYRNAAYYSRPGKGTWAVEGGGALINQAIHQIDLLLHLAGPVESVQATWQLGACHAIESEDVVNALVKYRSGATGVVQASTSFWPGMPERIELHGTKGTAIVTGDQLTNWQAQEDGIANAEDPAPVGTISASGASNPMAIGSIAFERQFKEFASALKEGRQPSTSLEEGYRALDLVESIYEACRSASLVQLSSQ